jgi:hypothetical protein
MNELEALLWTQPAKDRILVGCVIASFLCIRRIILTCTGKQSSLSSRKFAVKPPTRRHVVKDPNVGALCVHYSHFSHEVSVRGSRYLLDFPLCNCCTASHVSLITDNARLIRVDSDIAPRAPTTQAPTIKSARHHKPSRWNETKSSNSVPRAPPKRSIT